MKVPYCTYLSFELKELCSPFDQVRYPAKVVQEPFTKRFVLILDS
jgi:hypothetical protein